MRVREHRVGLGGWMWVSLWGGSMVVFVSDLA